MDGISVIGVTRVSQLSESSFESTEEIRSTLVKRAPKHGSHSNTRSFPPLIGVPKFCQLAASLKSTSRRRKDDHRGKSIKGVLPKVVLQPDSESSNQVPVEVPTINLQVVLPMPSSGLNLVINNDGDFVPDSTSEVGEVVIRREEEAKILIDIQKVVGFTFEGGEDEIQSKMRGRGPLDYKGGGGEEELFCGAMEVVKE
ncbi:hypothetical protein TSUD_257100 [Trifolium subterraneum]|uniref:Uncharacterized protein n=1 Tax=Trifolium subterraneum TaxID=3900 RepID=A0A2Z6MTQ0_TRISU|nr:hypothetical protein TSUD_257100 [Trifolium subterraneum]